MMVMIMIDIRLDFSSFNCEIKLEMVYVFIFKCKLYMLNFEDENFASLGIVFMMQNV